MSFLDRFRKRKAASPVSQPVLPSLCWGIAYVILPHYAFKDCDKLVGLFTDTQFGGPFFYVMACQSQKIEPMKDDGLQFRVHHGQFDDAHDYYALEYPKPPAVDLSQIDPESLLSSEQLPVLAPYFSVVVRHHQTKAVRYYALGQSPVGGGTTLRSVTPDGANCNLGPGPEARLDAFLARLKGPGDELKTVAAWKP